MDFAIDFHCHSPKRFRLEEGMRLHLVEHGGRKFTVRLNKLIADEEPKNFGGTAEVGQVATITDGRWILCMSLEDHPQRLGVHLFDSIADLCYALWDTPNSYAVADCLLMLWAVDAIKLGPTKLGPNRREIKDSRDGGYISKEVVDAQITVEPNIE